jgi:dihydrofolate reductase
MVQANLSMIAAVARNRVIGKDNRLLWHLPEDMKHFREVTRGKPVIMGRKTWEPLPGRHNIVLSRAPDYTPPGAAVAGSLDEALRLAGPVKEVFIIGGEALYRQALPQAQRLYLTEIDQEFEGDAFFPEFKSEEWVEVSRRRSLEGNGPACSFVEYRRA